MSERAARFPWKVYVVLLAIIVLIAVAPLLSVTFTYLIADAHGCTVNEANVHPCLVFGQDWGELLYVTAFLGWLMLATLPLGGGAVIVWLVILSIHYIAWRQSVSTP